MSPPEETGVISPIKGYYTFRIEQDEFTMKFFGKTAPTAKTLLGQDMQMPLREHDVPMLKEVILQSLDPLRKNGYSIVERE